MMEMNVNRVLCGLVMALSVGIATMGSAAQWSLLRFAAFGSTSQAEVQAPGQPEVPNTLTNSLVAYYRMQAQPVTDAIGTNNLAKEGTFEVLPGIEAALIGPSIGPFLDGGAASNIRLYANGPDFALGSDDSFTISAWVNNNGIAYSSYPVIAEKGSFYDASGWLLYYSTGEGFKFNINAGAQIKAVVSSLGASPDGSTWYHVVGRHDADADTITINVNGTNYQNSTSWTYGTTNYTAAPFSLFAPSTGSSYRWAGYIDDVGFWKRCLTDSEVGQIYQFGSQRAHGAPWGEDWTNKTIVFNGDARFDYAPAIPYLFQTNTWARTHDARMVSTNGMYVLQWADASYPPITNQLTKVLSYAGAHTNLYWVCEVGINDIILGEGNGYAEPFTKETIAATLTNHFRLLSAQGVKVIPWTCWGIIGETAAERQAINYLNTAITNCPWITTFFDAEALVPTNGGWFSENLSELNAAGNLRVMTNFNNLMNSLP